MVSLHTIMYTPSLAALPLHKEEGSGTALFLKLSTQT